MVGLITPAFGRLDVAARLWPQVRALAGCDIKWIIAIDGDQDNPAHQVIPLYEVARQYADCVVVLPSHQGNGAALEAAKRVAPPGALLKLDMDVLPNPGWAAALLDYLTRWDDGRLGLLCGLTHARSRKHDLGPRRSFFASTRLFGVTPAGRAALGDMTTRAPWGQSSAQINRRIQQAGLWLAWCHAAYAAEHDDAGSLGA